MQGFETRKDVRYQACSGTAPLCFRDVGQQIIHNMPLGVVAFDSALKITDSNLLSEKLLAPGGNIAEVLQAGSRDERPTSWADALREVLASEQTVAFEPVSYSWNGMTYALRMLCTPLADEQSGQSLGGILLIDDITAQKAMEKDLADAERLAAVGKLAARVAHELNNPLDGILRYINLALRVSKDTGPPQVGQYLRESRKGLMRMVQIISELLEFSRSSYFAFQEAQINKIVEDALKVFESQASEQGVAVIRDYAPRMPNVRSGNLFQVFCNLIKNAIDAMPEGGRLHVGTRCDEQRAWMEFSDTGAGLTDEVQAKMFEPFFSTKESGKGTGLGLAICKDIVERYGGQIAGRNRPGGGSVFSVSIPLERTSWGVK